jgi:hypothetical protein
MTGRMIARQTDILYRQKGRQTQTGRQTCRLSHRKAGRYLQTEIDFYYFNFFIYVIKKEEKE